MLNSDDKLRFAYSQWHHCYANYKQLMELPMFEVGAYSMATQKLYYSMFDIIEIIFKEKKQKEKKDILQEINDCITSIRMHLLSLRKQNSHPEDKETLDYLSSLFKRFKTPECTLSDESLIELQKAISMAIQKQKNSTTIN